MLSSKLVLADIEAQLNSHLLTYLGAVPGYSSMTIPAQILAQIPAQMAETYRRHQQKT